jgi:hypothetical protein
METFTRRFEKYGDSLAYAISQRSGGHWILFPLFTVCLAVFNSVREADPDLFARVAVGRLFALNGNVVVKDPFAYTPTKAIWYDHEWLSGVLFYYASALSGDIGLFGLKLLVAFSSIAIAYHIISLREKVDGAAFTWFCFCLIGSLYVWNNTIRCRSFTFLFFLLVLLALELYREKGSRIGLFFMPLLFCIWANMHAGFVVGLAILGLSLGIFVIRESKDRGLLCTIGLLTLASTVINPYGIEYWTYVIEAIALPRGHIEEWAPPPLHSSRTFLLAISAAILFFGRRPLIKERAFQESAVLLFTLYLACRHDRLAAFFFLSMMTYGQNVWRHFIRVIAESHFSRYISIIRRILAYLFVSASLASFVLCIHGLINIKSFSLSYDKYPVNALEWLRENREGGNVMVDFTNGSYALWRLYPQFLISLDGRYEEVYPNETFDSVFQAYNQSHPKHEQSLKAIWPDYILLATNTVEFLNWKKYGEEWQLIYSDERYSILGLEEKPLDIIGHKPKEVRAIWKPLF